MSFFEELKRRNVFRVAVAYGVASWAVLQVAEMVLEAIEAPSWTLKALMLLVVLGFVAAMFVAWAFEITPEGIKREADVDRSQSVVADTGRRLDRIIIIFLVVAVLLLLGDRYLRPPADTGQASQEDPKTLLAAPKSIAVLAFADLSQAKDQEWFADGLAEEILNALAKTPDLLVSSRTSSFAYKGSSTSIGQIARELRVENILEGSVRNSGGRIRVTAQLIRARDGFHVWSENYDREEADMIAIQEDLAVNIAKALKTTMDPKALAAMTSVGTRSVEAYEEYLRGLGLLSKANAVNQNSVYLQAYESFEKARKLDPNFSAAGAQAAEFWRVQITPSRFDSGLTALTPEQALAMFNERIDQAISSAASEIDRQGYQGVKALLEMRLRDAIKLFTQYLEVRPNDELVRYTLMDAALMASDQKTKETVLEHWRERGATDVDAADNYANFAYRVTDPSVAADYLLQALQRWPGHASLLYQTHRTLLWAGRVQEAHEIMNRFNRQVPGGTMNITARQACAEGRRDEVEQILTTWESNKNPLSMHWHLLKLLGQEAEAEGLLRPISESGIPYQIADMLGYLQFDPSPYPALMAVLEREHVNRKPALDIPFKCPAPEDESIAVLSFAKMITTTENRFFLRRQIGI